MSTFGEPALIISDGGLASLLACFIEGVCRPAAANPATGDRAVSVAWFAPPPLSPNPARADAEYAARRAAAVRACEVCHLNTAPAHALTEWSDAADHGADSHPDRDTAMLVAAGAEALRRGLNRVVWPVALGGPGGTLTAGDGGSDRLERLAIASDRALACARLLAIDAGDGGLVIQTPFIDFTDAQLADLTADVDAPASHLYAWLGDDDHPDERDRWVAALRAAGLSDPFRLHPVATVSRSKHRLKAV